MAKQSALDMLLGFDSRNGVFQISTVTGRQDGIVQPSEMFTIVSRPQVPFACRKFFVHAPAADDFVIHELRIGWQSQKAAGTAPIICSPFALRGDALPLLETALLRDDAVVIKIDGNSADLVPDLRLPCAMAGMDVFMQVEHIGTVPRRFLAAMIGESDPR